jgi:hypothetical protein
VLVNSPHGAASDIGMENNMFMIASPLIAAEDCVQHFVIADFGGFLQVRSFQELTDIGMITFFIQQFNGLKVFFYVVDQDALIFVL